MNITITKIIVEMIVVGISLVIMSLLITTMQGEDVTKLPHLQDMIFGTFVSGASLHLLFELVGLNKWYVDNYYQ